MKKKTVVFICLIIALLPAAYLLYIWNSLPAVVPTHWGASSEPNAYGSKNTLIMLPAIFSGITILIVLLILNLDKIDPKKGKNMPPTLINKLSISLSLFMAAIALYILYITQSKSHQIGNFIFFLVGFLFAVLGNILYSVKQNFFIGARLPWTLSNEENWNKTNRLMSKLFFASGIIIIVCSFFVPTIAMTIITLTSVLGSTIYCIVFSYLLFRKQQQISK
ncbi:MAG: SdpI family protein [Ferruginibacter sp.]